MFKILLSVLFSFFIVCPFSSYAAPLNATKIGAVWTTTPVAETAFQALQGFRGAFTPINLGMSVGTYVIISTIGDGINAIRAEMANPLPSANSPAGWSNSETPPSVSSISNSYSPVGYSGTYASGQAACNSVTSSSYIYEPGWCSYAASGYHAFQVSITSSCPVGYTLSGGQCNLTNAAAVMYPSDGRSSVKPVLGVLTPNPRDPDNTGLQWSSPYTRTGTDTFNNPVSETITSNAANGIDYSRDTQGVNPATGEPMVQRDKYSTDANGQVTSTTSITYNNSTINNVNTTAPTTPTDVALLSKESTQQQIKTLLTPPQTNPDISADPVTESVNPITESITAYDKSLSNNPAPMLNITPYWTYATGTCYPAVFDMGRFGSVSLDHFCAIYDEHIKPLLIFVFGVFAVLHTFAFWTETIRQAI